MSRTDTAQLCTLRTEVLIWRALESAVREPVAVYAPPATGGVYNVRIAIRQRVPGEARNAIAAAFGSLANVKNVFVVDPDIDIFSDEQMEWALATRFQPDRDFVVASAFRTIPLDPSLASHGSLGAKAGYDLTMPIGSQQEARSRDPGAAALPGRALRIGRGGAARRPEIFRGPDDRARHRATAARSCSTLEALRRQGPAQARPGRRALQPDGLGC